jgi:hypothetical protein
MGPKSEHRIHLCLIGTVYVYLEIILYTILNGFVHETNFLYHKRGIGSALSPPWARTLSKLCYVSAFFWL